MRLSGFCIRVLKVFYFHKQFEAFAKNCLTLNNKNHVYLQATLEFPPEAKDGHRQLSYDKFVESQVNCLHLAE